MCAITDTAAVGSCATGRASRSDLHSPRTVRFPVKTTEGPEKPRQGQSLRGTAEGEAEGLGGLGESSR